MPIAYQIRVYDTAGALKAVIDRFRGLQIEHRTNLASTLTLAMFAGEDAVQYFTLDSIIEVRRRYPEAGLDWYTEFVGFHRTPQKQITAGDLQIFTSYSRGLLDLINRRSVRYYADTDGSSKGPAPADDVIKDFVRENAGPLALTANGRLSYGVTPGLSVAANTSQASTFEGADAWRNLLEVIRDIGEPHNVDFDVVWLGGASFEFRTYYPHLGTDRREGTANGVVFSTEFANMVNPSHTVSRTDEITSCLVLGPGEGPLRDTTLVSATTMNDSPFNIIEQDQNASGEDREAALIAVGNAVLYEKRAKISVSFEPLQTPYTAYQKHYFLGDIVTCRFSDVTADCKIRAVTVNLDSNAEAITVELEEPSEEFMD